MEVMNRTLGIHARGVETPPRQVAGARIHPLACETAAPVCFGPVSTSLPQGFHGAGFTP